MTLDERLERVESLRGVCVHKRLRAALANLYITAKEVNSRKVKTPRQRRNRLIKQARYARRRAKLGFPTDSFSNLSKKMQAEVRLQRS